jgi:hypothetical protein
MVIKLAGAADIAPEQRYFNIETVGNTSAASIPGDRGRQERWRVGFQKSA